MGVGEPDFSTPWNITEAAIRSLEQGFTMYTSNAGMPELRKELAAYLKRTYGLEYDPNTELLITNGVSEGLDLAVRAILDPGDEVIMPDPGYVAYPAAVLLADGVPVQVPTLREWIQAVGDAVRDAVTSRTKAILIGYPANPTGAVMEMDKLAEIAEVAKKRQLLVISDEIYSLLVYDMQPACFAMCARHEGSHHPAGRILQGLRHDGLAHRLCRGEAGDHRGHDQDPPVHRALFSHHGPGGGYRSPQVGRAGGPEDDRRVRPAPPCHRERD